MALLYDDTNTGVFYRLGRIIKAVNDHLTNATTTLPAQLLNIANPYEAADMTQQIAGLYAAVEGMRKQEQGNRSVFASYADKTLLDRDSVLTQLSLINGSIPTVLDALFRQMETDTESVLRNVVTVGSVSAGAGNTGNGTVLLTKKLDGYNRPGGGMQACTRYAGLDSQLAPTAETITFTCATDSYRDKVTAGRESFKWAGGVNNPKLGYLAEGSGVGPTLSTNDSKSLLTNGGLQTFSSNVPSGWSLTDGTAGTHLLETTTTGEFYRGDAGAKFVGDGAAATIRITQDVASKLRSRRMYCLTLRMKASAAVAAGTFLAQLSGTGYSAGSGEYVSVAFGSLPTSFTLYNAFIVMPATIPDDLVLEVKVTGTLTNAKVIYFGDVFLSEVVYHGGIGAVVVPGATPFVVDDKFTSAISNSDAGKFQTFFRKKYGFQLPSVTSSPTIAEALVA